MNQIEEYLAHVAEAFMNNPVLRRDIFANKPEREKEFYTIIAEIAKDNFEKFENPALSNFQLEQVLINLMLKSAIDGNKNYTSYVAQLDSNGTINFIPTSNKITIYPYNEPYSYFDFHPITLN